MGKTKKKYNGWQPGQSGNPNGRPKIYHRKAMMTAISRVEKEKNINYLETVVKRSLIVGNEALMAKIVSTIVPSLKAIEVKTEGSQVQATFNISLGETKTSGVIDVGDNGHNSQEDIGQIVNPSKTRPSEQLVLMPKVR